MIPESNVNSFTIDHTDLRSGIYIAREGKGFTTYDIRVVSPALIEAMEPAAAHSLEHLLATWFRNSSIKDDVVAVDGMMCLTGFYLILTGNYTVDQVRKLMIEALDWVLVQTEVPATTKETCGNHKLHDLNRAKYYAKLYKFRLEYDFCSTYKKIQVILKDGNIFQDS